jgi:hypothetical protein
VATRVAAAQAAQATSLPQRVRVAREGTHAPSRPRTASAQPIAAPSGIAPGGWLLLAVGSLAVAAGAWALRRGIRG